jgi:hypothetical protein
MDLSRKDSVRPDSPVLGTSIFLEHLHPLPSPGVVGWNAEAFPYDAIYFRPEQEFVHRELLAGAQTGCRFIANL